MIARRSDEGPLGIKSTTKRHFSRLNPNTESPTEKFSIDLIALSADTCEELEHGIRYRPVLPAAPYMATFAIASISACDDARLSVGGHAFDLEGIDDALHVQVTGGDIVEIVEASKQCRVAFTSVRASRIDAKPT